ncbi:MAG: asparagine synthase (glutamine-hydrolyzing) [Candidatus Moranbacteria bacterium]|nr:asparagine synthase (glutamine-hydrolyzing) [Candidatus Moranbacteria bacterium]
MCGINGKIYFNQAKVDQKWIQIMNQKISHRGPDDSGVYLSKDEKVGLGHQRLAIIDLSKKGAQPMSYLNRYHIVFNGEIYNFQEHRENLKKQGYKFNSKTDTEVILALYDKYKESCLKYLRGMFAFAIYDKKEKTVFCARDRIGKKPFKYYLDSNVFIFSSELKSILTQKECPKEPDFEAINYFLTFTYCPSPLTGFRKIKKLEPAHYLKVNLKTKKIEKKSYWDLDFSNKLDLSEAEWQERILEKLEESTKIRMISDVSIGAFLSGGIDSSAVVGMMSRLSQKPIKTFSVGFEEQEYNELSYAKIIAEKFKTEHSEIIVKPDKIEEILPKLVYFYEEPYADNSMLPTYYLSKEVKKLVTVALNGDGGDENFAGYKHYAVNKFASLYNNFRPLNNALVFPFFKFLNKFLKNKLLDRAHLFSKSIKEDGSKRYLNYLYRFSLGDQKKAFDYFAKYFKTAQKFEELDRMLYTDIKTYLADDLMVKMDIASMACGLEGRSPFLDHEMLELTAKMPFNLKLKGLNNKKYILKKALEKDNFIPKEVMYRSKRGFVAPLGRWFKDDKNFPKYAESKILNKDFLETNGFDEHAIKEVLNKCNKNPADYYRPLWTLLCLSVWFEEYH